MKTVTEIKKATKKTQTRRQIIDSGQWKPHQCSAILRQEWKCSATHAVSASAGAAGSCSRTVTCWNAATCVGTCCHRDIPTWTLTQHAADSSHHLTRTHNMLSSGYPLVIGNGISPTNIDTACIRQFPSPYMYTQHVVIGISLHEHWHSVQQTVTITLHVYTTWCHWDIPTWTLTQRAADSYHHLTRIHNMMSLGYPYMNTDILTCTHHNNHWLTYCLSSTYFILSFHCWTFTLHQMLQLKTISPV